MKAREPVGGVVLVGGMARHGALWGGCRSAARLSLSELDDPALVADLAVLWSHHASHPPVLPPVRRHR